MSQRASEARAYAKADTIFCSAVRLGNNTGGFLYLCMCVWSGAFMDHLAKVTFADVCSHHMRADTRDKLAPLFSSHAIRTLPPRRTNDTHILVMLCAWYMGDDTNDDGGSPPRVRRPREHRTVRVGIPRCADRVGVIVPLRCASSSTVVVPIHTHHHYTLHIQCNHIIYTYISGT